MKIAICFFGQVKNFNSVTYDNYYQNIIDPLLSKDHEIEYYLVTYNNTKYTNPWSNEDNTIDYNSINSFFAFQHTTILDIHSQTIQDIDIFVCNELSKRGYAKEWGHFGQQLTMNSIRQLYGLSTLYPIVKDKYKKYIMVRPDCEFLNTLDETLLHNQSNLCVPNFSHWGGYNDRFAIVDNTGLQTYTSRYDEIISSPVEYHAERYLKSIIDKYQNTLYCFDHFKFLLLRANGTKSDINY